MGTFSSQIRGIDLPGIYAAAQQYRANEMQMQQQAKERDRQDRLRTLYAGAMGGDQRAIQGLQQNDPRGYLALQKTQLEQKGMQQEQIARQADQQRKEQDQAAENLTVLGDILRHVKTPQEYAAARAQALEMRITTPQQMPEQFNQQWNNAIMSRSEVLRQAKQARSEDTTDKRNYEYMMSLPAEQRPEFARLLSSKGIQINTGDNMAPTTVTQNKLQGDVEKGSETLAQLNDIKQRFDPQKYMAWGSGFKTGVANLASRMGADSMLPAGIKDFADERDKMRLLVKRIKLPFGVEITGSAGSEKQFDEIASAVIDTDLAPREFAAKLQELIDFTERTLALKRQILATGFDLYQKTGVGLTKEQVAEMVDLGVKQGIDVRKMGKGPSPGVDAEVAPVNKALGNIGKGRPIQ